MDFVEKIIMRVEEEERRSRTLKVSTSNGSVELIAVRITGDDGQLLEDAESRIMTSIHGREIITSSFVNHNNAIYFIALCKK